MVVETNLIRYCIICLVSSACSVSMSSVSVVKLSSTIINYHDRLNRPLLEKFPR